MANPDLIFSAVLLIITILCIIVVFGVEAIDWVKDHIKFLKKNKEHIEEVTLF